MKTAILSSDPDFASCATTCAPSKCGHARGDLASETTIAGKYLLRRVLGKGAFGVVYEAEHLGLARTVAVKVYHASDDSVFELLPRIQQEARLSALVRHEHVVEIYDTGTLDDGSPYLVMEFIEGETLTTRLKRGPLSIDAVVELGCQVLDALDALSHHGMVHRDIKPDNLMLALSDTGDVLGVKLVDFGICKQVLGASSARMTQEGMLIGTPSYMPPEQISAQPVDHRSDLYAVGAVLYEAITGRPPHPADSLTEQVLATLHAPLCAPRKLRPGCPVRLSRLIVKALARKPERRPASARQMRDQLARLAKELGLARGSAAFCVEGEGTTRNTAARALRSGRAGWWAASVAAAAFAVAALGSKSEPADAQSSPLPVETASKETMGTPWSAPKGDEEAFLATTHNEEDPSDSLPVGADIPPAPQSAAAWQALMRRALTSYVRGDLRQAQRLYQRAVELEPSRAEGWRGLALTAGRRRQRDQAQVAFTHYSELADPGEREIVQAHLTQWQAL